MTTAPSPWSKVLPTLQLAWDATSLNALMFCARRYYYEIVNGYRGSNVHLKFGGFFASTVERYKKARLLGASKEEAKLQAIQWLVEATWPEGQDQPWGGEYKNQWRCTGTEKYKNKKGNNAKCPWAHKGVWIPGEGPTICGECGSPTEQKVSYVPADRYKHRLSLVRLAVWWIDDQPEDLRAGFAPLKLADGSPAVELSVKLPLPFKAGTGEPYMLTAHLDELSEAAIENFITDNKTTTKPLNERYWQQYAPNTQVDTYDVIGSTLFRDMDIQGVVIDAAQVLKGGGKFGRHILHRTEAQREEYLTELRFWFDLAERYARSGSYPMNRSHCFTCPFNGVCSKDPSRREAILRDNFEVRKWNPLEER